MQKNQNYQYSSNPQTQAPPMPSPYAYTVDENAGSSSQPASASSIPPEDDDDDICPVCESECTCANRSRTSNSLPTNNYPSGYLPAAAQDKPPSGLPSLKIKLTLGPRPKPQPHPHASGSSSKSTNTRPSSSKKKSKNPAETTHAGGSAGGGGDVQLAGPPFSPLGQSIASSGGGGSSSAHYNVDGALPKKRGRPTKAVVAAREAAKSAPGVRHLDAVTSHTTSNAGSARQSKHSTSRRTAQVKSAASVSNAKKKGKKLHGAAAASRARAQQRKAHEKTTQTGKPRRQAVEQGEESSELSDLEDDEDEDDEMGDLHSLGLPTFISAFSSSSNSSSSDSGSDTDSDSDKGTQSIPCPRVPSPLQLLGDNDHAPRKRHHHNTWDIRVRKRSVGADGSSDGGMETDSGEEEEEEEEDGDNEADADDNDEETSGLDVQHLRRYSGIATGWTDDEEESSFDADLFFANLSDSSGAEVSDDEQMGDAEVGFGDDEVQDDEFGTMDNGDMMRLSEVAAAGFLAPFADMERAGTENLPFGQGWDHLSLSSTLKDSLLDFDAHASRGLPLGSLLELPIPGYEEVDAMMATSEEEEAVAMFDNCSTYPDEEDGVEIFEDSDGGETTEDEFVDVNGIATPRRDVLLRFPASLGAIDPMSTVSSPVRGPGGRERTLSVVSNLSGKREREPRTPPLRPSDILSGKVFLVENKRDVSASPTKSTSKEREPAPVPAPAMGSFAPPPEDKSKRVVISEDSPGGVVPCPYPVVRRLRGRGNSVGMFSRSGSDRSHHSRTPSSLSAARSPFNALTSGEFEGADETMLPLGEPIQLDDVIDTTFLELEPSDAPLPKSTVSETCETGCETGTGTAAESESERDRHLESLRRWERIPIDAFRRTRVAGPLNDLMDKMSVGGGMSMPMGMGMGMSMMPHAPRPSDGFSYGSAGGGMLRGSPLNTTMWESDGAGGRAMQRSGGGKLSSLLVSPVILPVRDGDRTPTAERQHHHHQHQQQQQQQQQQQRYLGFGAQHAAHTAQNVKSRKELRKEKKRNRKFFGSAASHIRHNHFPNAKSRASGSMQRSGIPSLSL